MRSTSSSDTGRCDVGKELRCPNCGSKNVECGALLYINWDVNADEPVERNIDGREGEVCKDGAAWCVDTDCLWSGDYLDLELREV